MAETTFKRGEIEQALVGRTIAAINWRNDPIQATSTHSYSRDETDLAIESISLSDGTNISFEAAASLDCDDVCLSIELPKG